MYNRDIEKGLDFLAKRKKQFVCQECGYESAKWMGKCPGCQEWNSLIEEYIPTNRNQHVSMRNLQNPTQPEKITAITSKKEPRMTTMMTEFDRVLGGEIGRASCRERV